MHRIATLVLHACRGVSTAFENRQLSIEHLTSMVLQVDSFSCRKATCLFRLPAFASKTAMESLFSKKGSLYPPLNALHQALRLLKEHHRHSWVGRELEGLWKYMLDRGHLEVLELWVGDELVAADFGHPVGNVFYVATRFYQRTEEMRKLQPGFLLALVESKVLSDAGDHSCDIRRSRDVFSEKDTLHQVITLVHSTKMFISPLGKFECCVAQAVY